MVVISAIVGGDILYWPMPYQIAGLVIIGLTLLVSVLMVSDIPFYNFKHVHWNAPKKLALTLVFGVIVVRFVLIWGNWASIIYEIMRLVVSVLGFYVVMALASWPIRCCVRKRCVPKGVK